MDAACSIPPHGLTDTLFVKFHQVFGFGDERLWGDYDNPNGMLFVFTPTDEAPTETYQVRAFRNFLSEERHVPYQKGSVVRIFDVLEKINVDSIQTSFLMEML